MDAWFCVSGVLAISVSSQGSQNPSVSIAFWSVRGLLACVEIIWVLDTSGALSERHWLLAD